MIRETTSYDSLAWENDLTLSSSMPACKVGALLRTQTISDGSATKTRATFPTEIGGFKVCNEWVNSHGQYSSSRTKYLSKGLKRQDVDRFLVNARPTKRNLQ